MLVEQIHYNLLFRWFIGLGIDDRVWDATTFTKNRQRLMDGDVAQLLLEEVMAEATQRRLTSDEHFSVDGTLIQAWASQRASGRETSRPIRAAAGLQTGRADSAARN